MAPLVWSQELRDGRVARIRVTDRSDGNLSVRLPLDRLVPRRRAILDTPWVWLRQVHGSAVVVANAAGQHAGSEADASVTAATMVPLAAQMADCAAVGFVAANGFVAAAHAGWRGLEAGVLGSALRAMHQAGARDVVAVLGPCIHSECYEFGQPELDRLAQRFGSHVVATTTQGTPALDMPAAVQAELALLDVPLAATLGGCTSCESDLRWSYRARAEMERQALVIWIEDPGVAGIEDPGVAGIEDPGVAGIEDPGVGGQAS